MMDRVTAEEEAEEIPALGQGLSFLRSNLNRNSWPKFYQIPFFHHVLTANNSQVNILPKDPFYM